MSMVHYVIYDKPLDYPNSFVVRRWLITEESDEPIPDDRMIVIAPSLDLARETVLQMLPYGVCIPRSPVDEPQIVETWM